MTVIEPAASRDEVDELLVAVATVVLTWTTVLATHLAIAAIKRRRGEVHRDSTPRNRWREVMFACFIGSNGCAREAWDTVAGTDLGQLAMTLAAGGLARAPQNASA